MGAFSMRLNTMRFEGRSMVPISACFSPGSRTVSASRSGGISKRSCGPSTSLSPSRLLSQMRRGLASSGTTPMTSGVPLPSKSSITLATTLPAPMSSSVGVPS